jgi:tetratricopeptide (TPR) repeat protein
VEEVNPDAWSSPTASADAAPPSAEAAPHAQEPLLPDEELTTLPIPQHAGLAAGGKEPALEETQPALHETPLQEPEFELDQEFELVLEPENLVPPHEMLPPVPPLSQKEADAAHAEATEPHKDKTPVPTNGRGFSTDDFLTDLAKEIDDLGLDKLTPHFAGTDEAAHLEGQPGDTAQTVKEPVGFGGEPGPLKEVFDEFRAELGEMGSEDEDLETHYNLGIAFREMGLLEEAIGEFQKVAKANDRGKAFRYAMQCCTLLGLAFMEKGQPNIAAIWYERALNTPGVDGESKLALRYDLGVAQESAGDLEAALKSFSQVYAVNIDYRDVAERIASLQKPAR